LRELFDAGVDLGGAPGQANVGHKAMTVIHSVLAGVDSIDGCEVVGKLKAGVAYGYSEALGYHPILASRADTGEIVHARLRKGSANTQRGAKRFVEELVARVRRARASGRILLRFDSGFWSGETIAACARLDVRYTMSVPATTKAVRASIAQIPDDAWASIE
jgi:Transposase DDE domain group 1